MTARITRIKKSQTFCLTRLTTVFPILYIVYTPPFPTTYYDTTSTTPLGFPSPAPTL